MTAPKRVLGLVLTLLLLSTGCGRILGIEGAHVDPILDDDETDTEEDADESDDETDTVGLHPHNNEDDDDTDADAGSEVDTSDESSDTTAECVSFDNRRVPLLRSDGTLTPLPEFDTALR